jgi:hypothetical protein
MNCHYTFFVSLLFFLLSFVSFAQAGLVAQGLCYTACNTGWVACLSSSGIVAGTTGPVGWWAWLTSAAAGCSAVQGACMTACTPLLVAPTP